MVKKLTIFCMVFLLISQSKGQAYKIQDFLPDSLTSWQIKATGELSGNQKYQEDSYDEEDNQTNYNFGLNPNIRYRYKNIRPNYKRIYQLSLSYLRNKSQEEDYTGTHNKNNTSYYLRGKLKHRKYINQYGLMGDINFRYSRDNHFNKVEYDDPDNNNMESDITSKYLTILITPGISYGRIYSGRYGAKTEEIIHKLQDAGLLNRDLTKEEFLEFTQVMLNKRSQYHFDSRIKKMETLKMLLNYFREKNIIDDTSLDATLITEDIYSYDLPNFLLPRKFGYRLYLTPLINYRKLISHHDQITVNGENRITIDRNIKREYFYYGAEVGVDYDKIVNWNLFFNSNVNVAYLQMDKTYELEDLSSDYYESSLQTQIDFDCYYQFNSRSFLKFNNGVFYKKDIKGNEYDKDEMTNERYYIHSGVGLVYFITPKVSIDSNVSGSYSKNWYNDINIGKSGDFQYTTNVSVEFKYYF